jgi:hypothetical protein
MKKLFDTLVVSKAATASVRRRASCLLLLAVVQSCCVLFGDQAADAQTDTRQSDTRQSELADQPATVKIQTRAKLLIVQPIVLQDDDGQRAAVADYPKRQCDERLSASDTELLFLEPLTWRHTTAREGAISPAETVRLASEQGVLRRDARVIHWLFVSAIEGQRAPAVRKLSAGRVLLICLGDSAESPRATPVSILEQLVPSDLALDAPQRLDRLRFLGGEEARRSLTDESWEPYISSAPLDMVRFSLGLTADTPFPADASARQEFVTARYHEKVLDFTPEEQQMLRGYVAQLQHGTGADWPAVSRFPWHFLKVQASFCRGMAHTRGLVIVLSEANLQRIRQDQAGGVKLLLHEKLHVLQRITAGRFAPLYRSYGMEPVQLVDGEDLRLNVAQNPDCLQLNWAWRAGDQSFLYLTLLSPQRDGLFRFNSQLRRLQPLPGERWEIGAVAESTAEFDAWRKTFPVGQGFDHPNEISAYLSSLLLDHDYAVPAAAGKDKNPALANERLTATRREFRQALALRQNSDSPAK